jgi:putative hemolysin
MTGNHGNMNDKPPERSRRSMIQLRRFETGLASAMAVLLVGLWFTIDRSTASMAEVDGVPDLGLSGLAFIVAFCLLIAFNTAYVAAETALSLVKHVHVKLVSEQNPKKGELLHRLVESRQSYAAACWLGGQICRLVLVFVCLFVAPGAVGWLHPWLGWDTSYFHVLIVGAAIMAPVCLLNLVIELVPKSYATLHPHRVAVWLYTLIVISKAVFSPLVMLVSAVANLFTARFGVKASLSLMNQAEEEIKTLVESAQQTGEIESDEKELLHSVFAFTDTVAREVMTPRVDLDAVPVNSEATAVMEVIQKSGHSRIPVYEETDDQIVGIVHAKDLLMAMLRGKGRPQLATLMRPAYFVPENKDLHELLTEMRVNRTQMVIVQDEFGGTAGIVTIEDIVEELVGDIVDEYDVDEPEIIEVEDGWIVDGKMHLDDLNDCIGAEFESDEFDTVGGYVFGLFGRQPKQDESIDADNHLFTIVESDGRRIVRLKVAPIVDDSLETGTETVSDS